MVSCWQRAIQNVLPHWKLIDLARQNAQVQQSIDILAKLEELDKRVKANEEVIKKLTEIEEGGESEEVTYPEYVAGTWYRNGDIVLFEGKDYMCIAPAGQVCTWSPSDYPAYWKEV